MIISWLKDLVIHLRSLLSTSSCLLDRYKEEQVAKQVNNDNPFDTYVTKPEAGKGLFAAQPILIPSSKESR